MELLGIDIGNVEAERWVLTVDCDVVPAKLRNEAGIIGAAMAAAELVEA